MANFRIGALAYLAYNVTRECGAMNHRVGATEAGRKLPELLRGVQSGKSYTIMHRGRAIAELVPPGEAKRQDVAEAVEAMQRFMAARRPVRSVDIKALIGYGRK